MTQIAPPLHRGGGAMRPRRGRQAGCRFHKGAFDPRPRPTIPQPRNHAGSREALWRTRTVDPLLTMEVQRR